MVDEGWCMVYTLHTYGLVCGLDFTCIVWSVNEMNYSEAMKKKNRKEGEREREKCGQTLCAIGR